MGKHQLRLAKGPVIARNVRTPEMRHGTTLESIHSMHTSMYTSMHTSMHRSNSENVLDDGMHIKHFVRAFFDFLKSKSEDLRVALLCRHGESAGLAANGFFFINLNMVGRVFS